MEQVKLPPDWVAIVSSGYGAGAQAIVERCYALHNKPPKPLTDAEIDVLGEPYGYFKFRDAQGDVRYAFARAIEAAVHKKQREPEVVKFRAAKDKLSNQVAMLLVDTGCPMHNWEWLDYNGQPQEFEVKV